LEVELKIMNLFGREEGFGSQIGRCREWRHHGGLPAVMVKLVVKLMGKAK